MEKILKKMLLVGLIICTTATVHPAAGGSQKPSPETGDDEHTPELKIEKICSGDLPITPDSFNQLPNDLQHDIIDELVRKRGTVEKAFFYAAERGLEWALAPLIEKGATVNAMQICGAVMCTFLAATPLHRATQNGHKKVIRFLLNEKANIDALCSLKKTPLSLAINNRHKDIVKLLVDTKANIDFIDHNGDTYLHTALKQPNSSDIDTIKLLVKAGVKVNGINENNGNTPLHVAAHMQARNNKSDDIVKFLVNAKAELNAINENNLTPLFVAAMHSQTEKVDIVKFLIEAGAKIDKLNFDAIFTKIQRPFATAPHTYGNPAVILLLTNGYRAQLEQQYPTRTYKNFSEEEHVSLGALRLLPQEIALQVIDCLPRENLHRDLANLARASRGCRRLAYNAINIIFPSIKTNKFEAFINPTLQRMRDENIEEMIALLEQELAKGYAVMPLPATHLCLENGPAAPGACAVAISEEAMPNILAPCATAPCTL